MSCASIGLKMYAGHSCMKSSNFMDFVKKNRHKKLIHKLKVKNENFSEKFNQIRYNIKVEEVTIAKF